MRGLVQRVTAGSVAVDGSTVGICGAGYVIFLGVGQHDSSADAQKLWEKIRDLRICDDEVGRPNRSLLDTEGSVLIVSQFTLYADVRRGRRPSYTESAPPDVARALYEEFCDLARRDLGTERVGCGIFGADMHVSIEADGPYTIFLDTAELRRSRQG